MSHFTKIQTKIQDLEMACQALAKMSLPFSRGPIKLKGWNNQARTVDLLVQPGQNSYGIGLLQNGETFDIVADWMGVKGYTEESFAEALNQNYAYCCVVNRMQEQGFVIQTEAKEKGAIKVTLSRMV